MNLDVPYGPDSDIVDYIFGITYEIWEQRQVELIHRYYAPDTVVYGMDGITRSAQTVVDNTHDTLRAFPDRRLLAEDVIWSGSRGDGFYSSHRLLSVMTNRQASLFGPATGKAARMINIADCVVRDGIITKEWLVRDNMALIVQLGFDPLDAARTLAQRRSPELVDWLESEATRVREISVPEAIDQPDPVDPSVDPTAFAWRALDACWNGRRSVFTTTHAPYCVLRRSPLSLFSGHDQVFAYYESARQSLADIQISVDHVVSQPAGDGVDIAVRWSLCGSHEGALHGRSATGLPLFILGVTHWRCVAGRVATETTIFDDLALLSQTIVD